MFSRSPLALLAGMALAVSALVTPAAAAAPIPVPVGAAWGNNAYGQLGNDSATDSGVPVAVRADSGVLAGRTLTAIVAGWQHSCAVADGKVFCWGDNEYGQLGNDSTADSAVAVAVNTLGVLNGKTVTAIAAGEFHTCAVADGKAYCWGWNPSGQLGNDSTADSHVPVAVEADSGVLAGGTVTAITAGGYHTCAVADGQAYCWGLNFYGQLGNDSTTNSLVPVAVTATTGVLAGRTVTAISAGWRHTCAVADGTGYCWGYNAFGQLGNDSTPDSVVPVAVTATTGVLGGKTVIAITAGFLHTCAAADGQAYCWGNNGNGQFGNDSTSPSKVPVPVVTSGPLNGKTVTAITAGVRHTCAVADGTAYCWGGNYYGQLGNDSTTDSKVPVAVDISGPLKRTLVTAITAGDVHTAAIAAPVIVVPQPPTTVTGVAGDAKVTVSWAAPADDGGSPVLDYMATASPGAASCTTGGLSCEVSGLANGTDYTFTVTARNAKGVSAPSAPSVPVTPAAGTTPPPVQPVAPGKVTGVKAVVRKGTAKITWKSVPNATSYRVRISKPGGRSTRPGRPPASGCSKPKSGRARSIASRLRRSEPVAADRSPRSGSKASRPANQVLRVRPTAVHRRAAGGTRRATNSPEYLVAQRTPMPLTTHTVTP